MPNDKVRGRSDFTDTELNRGPLEPQMDRAMPAPNGSICQEASHLSHLFYIPCGRAAAYVVKTRDPKAYLMCSACADHNVKNRGARYVLLGEEIEIATNE